MSEWTSDVFALFDPFHEKKSYIQNYTHSIFLKHLSCLRRQRYHQVHVQINTKRVC